MEPAGSLSHSQDPTTYPYPQPDQSSPCPLPTSWKSISILSSHLRLSLPSGSCHSDCPHQSPACISPPPLCTTVVIPKLAICVSSLKVHLDSGRYFGPTVASTSKIWDLKLLQRRTLGLWSCGTWQLGSVDVHHSFEGMCFFPCASKREAAQSLLSKLPQFPGTASCDNTECGNLCTAGGVLH